VAREDSSKRGARLKSDVLFVLGQANSGRVLPIGNRVHLPDTRDRSLSSLSHLAAAENPVLIVFQ
jgi:hypothetical protein